MKNNNTKEVVNSFLIGLSAINPLTGALSAGWNDYKTNKEIRNIKYILESYSNKLEKFEEKISKIYLNSLEAKYLLEKVIFLAKDEIEDEVLNLYIEFLVNASSKKMFEDKGKKMVLNTLSLVNPLHLKLLNKIAFLNVNYFGLENIYRYDFEYLFPEGSLTNLISDETCVNPQELGYKEEEYLKKEKDHSIQLVHGEIENLLEANLNYMVSIGLIEKVSSSNFENMAGYYVIKGYKLSMLGIKILEYTGANLNDMVNEDSTKYLGTTRIISTIKLPKTYRA